MSFLPSPESLVQRLQVLHQSTDAPEDGDSLAAWHRDALEYLEACGGRHWWCENAKICTGLLAAARHRATQPAVRSMFETWESQLSECADCVHLYHDAQVRGREG